MDSRLEKYIRRYTDGGYKGYTRWSLHLHGGPGIFEGDQLTEKEVG